MFTMNTSAALGLVTKTKELYSRRSWNSKIGQIVKYVWKVTKRVLHNFLECFKHNSLAHEPVLTFLSFY